MLLLVLLSGRAGQLVGRREIFSALWGSAPVGDDSLNRVVALLRKSLASVAGPAICVETVPAAGYLLKLQHARAAQDRNGSGSHAEVERAVQAAVDSWRLALPEPDHIRMEQLRRACEIEPDNIRCWGFLALLARHAAEYDRPAARAEHVAECEQSARRAIARDPGQVEARVALISVVPLFGGWTAARAALSELVANHPTEPVAVQDLATLEMATGRVGNGKRLRDQLIAADPLAAGYCYKSVYQHWAVGDLLGMDQVAERAMQLWPTHSAVWMVRLWTLAYTGRAPAALRMLEDVSARPAVPERMTGLLRCVLEAAVDLSPASIDRAVASSVAAAGTGPANAIAAMFALGLFDRPDEIFGVAEAYYLLAGTDPVPLSHTDAEMSLNEQHRRVTQVLFMPVFSNMRGDPRFMQICERIGLVRHWDDTGVGPDLLN